MERKYKCRNPIASHAAENVSRLSLIKWVNDICGTNIQKVEELCSGTVYCQMLNMLFPGLVNWNNVKLQPRTGHECYLNFRVLQTALRSIGCNKDIGINTIVNGKFLQNFEFLKWFKKFWEANYSESTGVVVTCPGSSKPKPHSVFTVKPQYSFAERKIKLEYEISKSQEMASFLAEECEFYRNKLKNIKQFCEDASPSTEKKTVVNKILAELYATAEGFETPEGFKAPDSLNTPEGDPEEQ